MKLRNRVFMTILLTSLSLAASGCGRAISGHYELIRATPNPDDFAMDDVDFTRDGRYTALVTLGGRTSRENGSYEFNGYKLTLRPAGGGQRKYNAAARPRSLNIFINEKKIYLKKVKPPKNAEDRK